MRHRAATSPHSTTRCWRAIEDAGLNASAPREQRWLDGWLVRFSPGQGQARALRQGGRPAGSAIDEKLALCLPLFAAAGLPPIVRITPFSRARRARSPPRRHAAWQRVDDTRVMVARIARARSRRRAAAARRRLRSRAPMPAPSPTGSAWRAARRWRSGKRTPSGSRGRRCRSTAFWLRDAQASAVVACGQVVIEGEVVGLYDVFTAERCARPRPGASAVPASARPCAQRAVRASAICRSTRATTRRAAVYRRLGFADGYAYHYRTPPAGDVLSRARADEAQCLRRGRGARSSTAPRRRSRPCRGCRAGTSGAPGSRWRTRTARRDWCRCRPGRRSSRRSSAAASRSGMTRTKRSPA